MDRSHRFGLVLVVSLLTACSTAPPDPEGSYCLGGERGVRPLGEGRGAVLDSVATSATGADVRLVAGPSYRASICVQVGAAAEGGTRPVRLDVLGEPASTGAIAPEAQSLHCEGDARRDGARLIVDAPRCCEGDDCLARAEDACAYEARPLVLTVRADGVGLEPLRVRRAEPCGGRNTLGVRAGAGQLIRETVR